MSDAKAAIRENAEANVLFPREDGSNLSHTFCVADNPVVLSAANMELGDEVRIERRMDVGCEELWIPFNPCCCQERLSFDASTEKLCNLLIIALPGYYRAFLTNTENPNKDEWSLTVSQQSAPANFNYLDAYMKSCCCNDGG